MKFQLLSDGKGMDSPEKMHKVKSKLIILK